MNYIDNLPPEILSSCGTFCNVESLASLALINRRFHQIFNHQLYHRSLFEHPPDRPIIAKAAQTGRLDTIKRAVSFGADVNALTEEKITRSNWSEECATPLHAACFGGQAAVVDYLLSQGAFVDGHARSNHTPLFVAIWNHGPDREDVFTPLIKHGARVTSRACLTFALHTAVEAGCWPALDLLLSLKDDKFAYPSYNGSSTNNPAEAVVSHRYTALHDVSYNRDAEGITLAISKLIAAGAPLEATTTDEPLHNGGTPLTTAIKMMNWAAATAILYHGAELPEDDGTGFGMNILHLALRHNITPDPFDLTVPGCPTSYETDRRCDFVRICVATVKTRGLLSQLEQQSSSYFRHSNGTPLWFATCHAEDPDLMRVLLEDGPVSPNTTVQIQLPMATLHGGGATNHISHPVVSLLRALVDSYDGYWKPDMAILEVSELKDRIILLLGHGVRLDAQVDKESILGTTVLEVACQRANGGHGELLEIIVGNAGRRNVDLEFVSRLQAEYEDDSLVGASLAEFYRRLSNFQG